MCDAPARPALPAARRRGRPTAGRLRAGRCALLAALAALAVALVASGDALLAQPVVREHGITDGVTDGRPDAPRSTYLPDATVYAWARIDGLPPGATVRWRFEGPDDEEREVLPDRTDGDLFVGYLDLEPLSNWHAEGEWRVVLLLDGAEVAADTFSVEPFAGGLVWWGPFVGLAILLGLLGLVTYVAYRLLRWMLRRRDRGDQAPNR